MNQFLKRKLKDKQKTSEQLTKELAEDIVNSQEFQDIISDAPTREEVEAVADPLPTELTCVAYDLFYDAKAKQYKAAEIKYNPETGECKITNFYDAPRQVGLVADNQKSALKTILKVK